MTIAEGRRGAALDASSGPSSTTPQKDSAAESVDRTVRVKLASFAIRRPVVAIALLGMIFTAVQMWWILQHRHLGAFNVDEEGGLAAALRFHRNFDVDPRPLARVVMSTWNGPLVPLLSVPALMVGTRSAFTAMIVQPLLVVVCACAVTGIVTAVGHRRAALVAGVAVICLPISIVSSRSYQYSTGVGAFLALALWGLLASDRGRRRLPMLGFGASVGAMVLCRTMAIGFVPGVALAALVVIAWERRTIVNLVAAAATAALIAGPWWIVEWGAITRYIHENAYGDRAHYWGQVSIRGRFDDHLGFFINDFRVFLFMLPLLAAVSMFALVVRRRSVRTGRRPLNRPTWALGLTVLLGFVALFSTSNVGFWFAYPLDVMLVAWATVVVMALPAPSRGVFRQWRTGAAVVALLVSVVTFGVSLTISGGDGKHEPRWREPFIGGHAELQGGDIEADARMGSADDAVRGEAAGEWLRASTALANDIERLLRRNGTLIQTVTGEIHLFNANTIALTEETTGKGITGVVVNNTLEPPDRKLRADLSPRVDGVPRVLVIVEGRSLGFPNGRGWRRYRRLALEMGWVAGTEIPLPDGGIVVVYTHPDSIRAP